MIIILDGPKRTGKSTIIQKIKELIPDSIEYQDRNIFGKIIKFDNKSMIMSQLYLASLVNQVVIFDRSYPSECVYGQVYRNQFYNFNDEEQIMNDSNALLVINLPPIEIVSQIQQEQNKNEVNLELIFKKFLEFTQKSIVKNLIINYDADYNFNIQRTIKIIKEWKK